MFTSFNPLKEPLLIGRPDFFRNDSRGYPGLNQYAGVKRPGTYTPNVRAGYKPKPARAIERQVQAGNCLKLRNSKFIRNLLYAPSHKTLI
jgi:hypothetical protein